MHSASLLSLRGSSDIRKIIVPVDGSLHSNASVIYACRLLQQIKLRFLDVEHTLVIITISESQSEADIREVMESAWNIVENEGVQMSKDNVLSIFDSNDVATSIVNTATSIGGDLIVMGTHGRGFLARKLMGSVTENVIRQSIIPVLAIRNNFLKSFSLETIVVGFDGSDYSKFCLRAVLPLAIAFKSKVILMFVNDSKYGILSALDECLKPGLRDHAIDKMIESVRLSMDHQKVLLNNVGISNVETQIINGSDHPALSLIDICVESSPLKNSHVDLLVVGAKGKRRSDRIPLGSCAEGVVRGCSIPVLIVPMI